MQTEEQVLTLVKELRNVLKNDEIDRSVKLAALRNVLEITQLDPAFVIGTKP
jgi:hypothetical protein